MKLLALDFDGVISDSAPEAFVVALRTFCALHPETALFGAAERLLRGDASPFPDAVVAHPLYAPFLESMPLGNRAEDYAVVLMAIESGTVLEDQRAYDLYKAARDPAGLRTFHRRFYAMRTAMADADPAAWQRLMGAYPGVPEWLRRRAGDAVLAIATAKDRGSVGRLLRIYGIEDLFPEDRVLDKDTGVSKCAHLEHLQGRFGFEMRDMTFVDDKVSHLEAVQRLGVRCALAGWGYNGSRESERARELGCLVLALDDADALLFDAG
ncbi:MAG: HAD family hydrolase [Myxococcota bacterium]|nr:HAD family hydrolase [Myxococcota bacterium]